MEAKGSTQFTSDDLEQFFSLSSDLLAIARSDGYFMRVNAAFTELLGWSETELLSRPLMTFVHPDDQAISWDGFTQPMKNACVSQFRNRWRCSDNNFRWLEWNISPFQKSADRPTSFYCIARDVTERYSIQHALEESEQRFQEVFNQTFQLIWLLRPDGLLLEANEAVLSFIGFPRDHIIDRPLWEFPGCNVSPDEIQRLQEAIANAAQGAFIRYELDLLGGNHIVSTLDFSLKPLRDETGKITRLIAEGRDITEMKTAEAALNQLNAELEARVRRRTAEIQRYAEAIENMQDGFHLWKLENANDARSFRLMLSNPASEHLLSVPNEQVLRKFMPEVLPNLFDTDVPEICRHVLLSGQGRDLENVDYLLPTGEHRTFAVKLFSLDDQFLGVLFEDVTEQRRIQRQLSEQREQLNILFEQAGVGIARLDLDGRWIQANEKLCEILGYSCDELFQIDFQTITHPDDAAADQYYYESLLTGKLDSASLEKRYVRKTGESVWCSVTVSIIHDETQPQCFIAFIEDISERKAAALMLQHQKNELINVNKEFARTTKKLKTRNRELDQFAYVASHDLKAPLRAIANLATWIGEDISDILPLENRQQLDLMRGRIQRMEDLINGLLAYSRAGRAEAVDECVNVRQLVQDVVEMLDLPDTFIIDIDCTLPTVVANQVPLALVFSNLINNAIKHHHQSAGRINVHCQILSSEFYEFSVTDDGPGIDPAYHNKIFDIFQVLKARDTVENTGIGLAIVKKTIEAEGGEISIESQVGKGTTFRFTWPVKT